MTLADLLQQFGGGQFGGGAAGAMGGAAGRGYGGAAGAVGGALGNNPYARGPGGVGGAIGGMVGRGGGYGGGVGGVAGRALAGGGYGQGGRVQVVGQGGPSKYGAGSGYAITGDPNDPGWQDFLRKATGGQPQPQRQLQPIQRHQFNVGNWGGMHSALAARGNTPTGGYQAQRPTGGTLADLIRQAGF